MNSSPNLNTFEIEKKIDFNSLIENKEKIEDFKIYYTRISNQYEECDKN
jgi:hypothetical protein